MMISLNCTTWQHCVQTWLMTWQQIRSPYPSASCSTVSRATCTCMVDRNQTLCVHFWKSVFCCSILSNMHRYLTIRDCTDFVIQGKLHMNKWYVAPGVVLRSKIKMLHLSTMIVFLIIFLCCFTITRECKWTFKVKVETLLWLCREFLLGSDSEQMI